MIAVIARESTLYKQVPFLVPGTVPLSGYGTPVPSAQPFTVNTTIKGSKELFLVLHADSLSTDG